MKKTYLKPKLTVCNLTQIDVLKASDIFDLAENDLVWEKD